MVYILLGKGFEEAEAIVPCDILRRGGVDVALAGVGGREISGGHGIKVTADCAAEEITDPEMIVIPGGMGGVQSIMADGVSMGKIKEAHDEGKYVAAICAGPMVLAALGIMEGVSGVCYPGLEGNITGGIMSQRSSTAACGNIITGRGPGAAYDFGFALLTALRGEKVAGRVAADMCCK